MAPSPSLGAVSDLIEKNQVVRCKLAKGLQVLKAEETVSVWSDFALASARRTADLGRFQNFDYRNGMLAALRAFGAQRLPTVRHDDCGQSQIDERIKSFNGTGKGCSQNRFASSMCNGFAAR